MTFEKPELNPLQNIISDGKGPNNNDDRTAGDYKPVKGDYRTPEHYRYEDCYDRAIIILNTLSRLMLSGCYLGDTEKAKAIKLERELRDLTEIIRRSISSLGETPYEEGGDDDLCKGAVSLDEGC